MRARERGDFQSAALCGLDLAVASHAWLTAVMWAAHIASLLFEPR